jgi:hypothetical protein
MNTQDMNDDIMMNDKYDLAIAYLTENPEEIYDAWGDPEGYEGRGGELFGYVGPDWTSATVVYDTRGVEAGRCGCLQQIREAKIEGHDGKSGNYKMAHWPRLWRQIAGDRLLPSDANEITVDDLSVFAEWQRKIDILRRQDA